MRLARSPKRARRIVFSLDKDLSWMSATRTEFVAIARQTTSLRVARDWSEAARLEVTNRLASTNQMKLVSEDIA